MFFNTSFPAPFLIVSFFIAFHYGYQEMKALNCHIKEHSQLSPDNFLHNQSFGESLMLIISLSARQTLPNFFKIPLNLLVLNEQLLLLSHPRTHTMFILSSNREDSLPQSSPCWYLNKGTTIFLPPLLSSHQKQNSAQIIMILYLPLLREIQLQSSEQISFGIYSSVLKRTHYFETVS